MRNALAMTEIDSLYEALHHNGRLFFLESFLLSVKEISAGAELHHEPETVIILMNITELNDSTMAAHKPQNGDLIVEALPVEGVAQIRLANDLATQFFSSLRVHTAINASKPASPNVFRQMIIFAEGVVSIILSHAVGQTAIYLYRPQTPVISFGTVTYHPTMSIVDATIL